jgi:uncharacterized protein with PIN domain
MLKLYKTEADRRHAYYLRNRDRLLLKSKTRHNNNKIEINEANKQRMYLYRYGITMQERDLLIKKQMGRCAICSGVFSNKNKPEVDHCHLTGKIRGVLCTFCNSMLGYAKDRIDTLVKGSIYLNYSNSDVFTVVDGCLKLREESIKC